MDGMRRRRVGETGATGVAPSQNNLLERPQNKALRARNKITPLTRRKYIQRYISVSSVEAALYRRQTWQNTPSLELPPEFQALQSNFSPRFSPDAPTRPTSCCKAPQTPQLPNKAHGRYDVYPACNALVRQQCRWVNGFTVNHGKVFQHVLNSAPGKSFCLESTFCGVRTYYT